MTKKRFKKRSSASKPKALAVQASIQLKDEEYFNFRVGSAFMREDYVDVVLHAMPAPGDDGRWRLRVWLTPPSREEDE